MPVQVLHGIRSNANSLRSILPPPQPPRRVPRPWRHNFRFVVLLVCFLLCTALSMNAGLLEVTMICWEKKSILTNQKTERNSWMTGTDISAEERQWLMLAPVIGSLVAVLPTVHLYACFGARLVLFWAGLLSAVATAAIPLAAFIDFWALFLAHFVQVVKSWLIVNSHSLSGHRLCIRIRSHWHVVLTMGSIGRIWIVFVDGIPPIFASFIVQQLISSWSAKLSPNQLLLFTTWLAIIHLLPLCICLFGTFHGMVCTLHGPAPKLIPSDTQRVGDYSKRQECIITF